MGRGSGGGGRGGGGRSGGGGASQAEITRWKRILDKNISGPNATNAKDRLRAYLGSIALGRPFGQSMPAYLEQAGLQGFYDWALRQVGR